MEKNTSTFTVKVVTDPFGLPRFCTATTHTGQEYPFPASFVLLGQTIAELRLLHDENTKLRKLGHMPAAPMSPDVRAGSNFIKLVKMVRFEHDLGLFEAKQISDLLVNRTSTREELDDVVKVREFIVYKQSQEEYDAMKEASGARR